MTIWFGISLWLKRNDVADIAWGLGFVAVVWGLLFREIGLEFLNYANFTVILILTTIWGFRLAIHIYMRNKDKKEDPRYAKWREEWGKWFLARSYFQVFLLQGFFMLIISSSAVVASFQPSNFSILTFLGSLVWLVGFIFESVGDLQLTRFINDPNNRGKIMTEGLWRYTRHPNYFGEVTQWWGIFLIVVDMPLGYLAVVSPLLITFLILKVSGIPMLEEKYSDNLDFQEYKKRTNAFFPWSPKKED